MNRRTFLKTLVALGASLPLPLDLLAATEPEIDATWERIRDVWGLFEVDDYGTLSYANFEEPRTRFDAYGIDDASELDAWDIARNPNLAQEAQWHYQALLEERVGDEDNDLSAEEIAELAESGWEDWLENCIPEERTELDRALNECLADSPDWSGYEGELLYTGATAQGGAYQYFLQRDIEDLDALGVVIIEGEHPGSSYYAAELRIPVEEANAIAEENGWTIRFVREGAA
jgi:hypothetical protein